MWRSKRPCFFFLGGFPWVVICGDRIFVRHTKLRGGDESLGPRCWEGSRLDQKPTGWMNFRGNTVWNWPLSCGFLVGFWGEDFRGWQASFLFQVEGSGWDMFRIRQNIFHWDFSWMSSFGWLFTKSLNGILLGPQNPPDFPPGFHRDPFQRQSIAVGFSTSESWGLSRCSGCSEKKWTQKIPCYFGQEAFCWILVSGKFAILGVWGPKLPEERRVEEASFPPKKPVWTRITLR